MNLKLKICGMRDAANIAEVAGLQPDYMGFIFYKDSPRFVGNDFSMPELPDAIGKVGVFVNEDTSSVLEKVNRYALDYVQLHGNEPVEQVYELSRNVRIIKAFSVDDDFDFNVVEPYGLYSSHFLFDTKGRYFGGNAKVFDWSILKKYNQHVPFFLSGGIDPGNASQVLSLHELNIHAIDVNSGVEQSPAVKEVQKIKALKRAINL